MYYRFSKLAVAIIIINFFLTAIVGGIHVYNHFRLAATNNAIMEVMKEEGVTRSSAITILEERGVALFFSGHFNPYMGMTFALATLYFLYKFSKKGEFAMGFAALIASLLTSFIGGILLFILFFSGKLETK